jgi:DnaJ domain
MSEPMATTPGPWAILGLTPNATKDEVTSAYRMLATIHHPDHKGNPETFRLINKAYETLLESFDQNQALQPYQSAPGIAPSSPRKESRTTPTFRPKMPAMPATVLGRIVFATYLRAAATIAFWANQTTWALQPILITVLTIATLYVGYVAYEQRQYSPRTQTRHLLRIVFFEPWAAWRILYTVVVIWLLGQPISVRIR